jgi:hypothetical protein
MSRVISRELGNTNFIFCCLTQPGLEPTIYQTLCDHANHRTTDAVMLWLILSIICEHLLTLGNKIIIKSIDKTVEYSV